MRKTNNKTTTDDCFYTPNNSYISFSVSSPPFLSRYKRCILSFPLAHSLFALLLILLLAYNSFTVFYIYVPARNDPSVPENFQESGRRLSRLIYAVKEEHPVVLSTNKLQLTALPENDNENIKESYRKISTPLKKPSELSRTKKRRKKKKGLIKVKVPLRLKVPPLPKAPPFRKVPPRRSFDQFGSVSSKAFSTRVKEFFSNNNHSCKPRFFMTWISSLESFGIRELFTIESLFKSHPTASLLIVSNSIDSTEGIKLLQPFLDRNFHVTAVAPDYEFIFENTTAASWFDRLKKGKIRKGDISIGQNLSNLLRLALLYKYGGIYMDTDFIVLKSFKKLRNVIGAQNIDRKTKSWNRLNNALLIFDKKHPLLGKFIDEFVLTFDGNKWGYNGPYLVSRVVERENGQLNFSFSVLPPSAFYPVDWTGISALFKGPTDEEDDAKWLALKLERIRSESYAVHLWNRQSKRIVVEYGSIISRLKSDTCIFCNFST